MGSCIHMDGNAMVIENNQCHNVDQGITMVGDSAEVRNNQIVNFAGDGMRGLGSYLIFENNLVKNCYDVNDNHDDGFQSFTDINNPFVGNVLRGNIIINYENPLQPFKGTLQGIGCFDGPYVDWIIENNLVVVNHYHGISLYGADHCTIVNNTVVDIDSANSPNGTWILITDHKNGTPSSNCLIQNNISFGFGYGAETEFHNNLLVEDYTNFVSSPLANFRLSAGSSAIDGGETQEHLQLT
ncbi:MAG: right-handed parallel beta-helix repeat-containing protein [Saprospiraceae bacterium]|nr:right-handed parallel beta-helix repeat-containing protein [Saprospiraceae bacterium]